MADSFDPTESVRRRVYQHVRSFFKVLQAYKPGIPLSRFLTSFYKENKQMGSKDRRAVSRFAYHYFRLGHAMQGEFTLSKLWGEEMEEPLVLRRLVLAEFLCSDESQLVQAENPEWYDKMEWPLREKLAWLESQHLFHLNEVFPWTSQLSSQLDVQAYLRQFFIQPLLFLRMRKGKENKVMSILQKHQIQFERIGEGGDSVSKPVTGQTLALPNGTALDQIKDLRGLVEVQDLSSQRSLDGVTAQRGENWWDACSGAGGKSLLLMDRFPGINLLVSDIRPSILRNLDERFEAAGIREYRRKIVDLTGDTHPVLGEELFDGILLDAPCTGSGTWGRTPEMLLSFNESAITEFAELQKTIAMQAARHLKSGGTLHYITCSVFSAENEEVVDYICRNTGLRIEKMEYITGFQDQADTLFVSILK